MNPTSEVASSGSDFRSQIASSTSAPQGDGTVSSSTKSADPLETNQGFDKDEGQHPTVAIISASIFGVMIVILLAVIIYWFWRRRREKPSVVSFDREIMILNKGGSDYGHRNLLGFKSSKSRVTSESTLTLSDTGVETRTSMSSYRSSSSWTKSSELSEGSTFYEAPVIGYQSKQRGSITSKYYDKFPRTPTTTTTSHNSLRSFEETPFQLNTTQSYDPPDRTDRQMFIQEKIKELRQQMVSASNKGLSSAREVEALRATIKKWEDMQSSEWAQNPYFHLLPLATSAELFSCMLSPRELFLPSEGPTCVSKMQGITRAS
ncbi:hypothetical protein K435DRAFT_855807 [Dendrothele bispora CBS 962.96]|uniref:Uncharacterized protein n=1 Tax=Dendrothele bispora (strain CBS 962.96) TaxID=1314807 RepID=A0A4S8MAK3_DENBC|nr:hypothetical protein K435DRAFT_855807 [Dendrothele bispora CBS 962.96]